MKRILMIGVIILLFTLSFSSPSFAQLRKDVGSCKGKVVSVDSVKQAIVVRDYDSGTNMTFVVEPGVISSVREGSEVIVIYKKGTNAVRMVKVLSTAKPAVAAVPVTVPAKPQTAVPAASSAPAKKSYY